MAEPETVPKLVSIVSPFGNLLLRSPEETDAEAMLNIAANPQNVAYWPHLNRQCHTLEHYVELIRGWRASCLKADLFLVIVRRGDDKVIGNCMFQSFGPPGEDWEEGDCGIMIELTERSKGYGREGLRTLFDYVFGTLGLDRLTLSVAEENLPMRRLADKLGLSPGRIEPRAPFGRQVVYQLAEENWCIKHGRVES